MRERMEDWGRGLCKVLGKKLVELTGDVTPDIRCALLCTPQGFSYIHDKRIRSPWIVDIHVSALLSFLHLNIIHRSRGVSPNLCMIWAVLVDKGVCC